MAAVLSFKAVLESLEGGLGWVVVRVPPRVVAALTHLIRLRVLVSLGEETFRTSLFPYAGGGGHFVLVNKAMQRTAGVYVGAMVEFGIAPDLLPREAELPDELGALLDDEPGLREWYEALSEYTRREIGKWVLGVKSDAARMSRAEQMAERLLSTLEAERELPPVIAAAFHMRPKAKAGWTKMTETQRRNELMAVFYYRTPESRQKRIEKMLDAAEKR